MNIAAAKRGFTAIEMLIVISIIAIVAGLSVSSFVNYRKNQALEKNTGQIASMLERARYQTISQRGGYAYGVHLQSDQLFLYKTTYATSTDNTKFGLDPSVSISSINLSGGAKDVLFQKVTGETSATGTIVISVKSDPAQYKTITIYSTGVIQQK